MQRRAPAGPRADGVVLRRTVGLSGLGPSPVKISIPHWCGTDEQTKPVVTDEKPNLGTIP